MKIKLVYAWLVAAAVALGIPHSPVAAQNADTIIVNGETEQQARDRVKDMSVIEICCPKRQVESSDPFNATRMTQQVRVDMIGSVVLMDRSLVPGKTLQQLADYASMRSFASVDDIANDAADTTPTILSLFLSSDTAPDGMTEFDWAYLEALYKLARTAKGSAIQDAAWAEYRKKVVRAEE